MALVSSKHFYLSRFGGYSGLMDALDTDLVTIPDATGFLPVAAGVHHTIRIHQIISPTSNHYHIFFERNNSYIFDCVMRRDDVRLAFLSSHDWRDTTFSINLKPHRQNQIWGVGILNKTFYLINPDNAVECEFDSATKLVDYIKQNRLTPFIHGVWLHDIFNINSRNT